MNKIYYNENNVGLVNYTGGGSADIPSAFTSWEYDDYGRLKDFVLKDGVTNIPSYYQYHNTSLTSCTISSGVTSIGTNAFAYAGNEGTCFDLSKINLSGVAASTDFTRVFTNAYVCGNITIPNSLLSGATSGTSSTCYYMFQGACVGEGKTLNVDVYANNVVIPRYIFSFSTSTLSNKGNISIVVHGVPTFLSQQSFALISSPYVGEQSVTFADCVNPPDAPSYDTGTSSPFRSFSGKLYVPSAGLTAWKNKYTGIASQIQAIPS